MQRTENSEVCQIELPYGASHIRIDVPARNLLAVASPKDTAPAEDLELLVRKALRAPLGMACVRRSAGGRAALGDPDR